MNVNRLDLYGVLLAPVMSEKASVQGDENRRYVFKVRTNATKRQIKQATEQMFGVKVQSVNVLNVSGKNKRFGRTIGKRSDWKKAYIKLHVGHAIELISA